MIFSVFRKKAKNASGRNSFSSRLLWNPNGLWKDKWFIYEDGVLSGYKEACAKPGDVDVTINVKTSKLTLYHSDEFMRKLNLFKITTVCNVAHVFAAWDREQYESWIEIITYAVGKNFELGNSDVVVEMNMPEEGFDNDIIPYERAVEKEQRKTKDKSKRPADSRVDSIDSGNDGDESGLESSVSSLSLFEARKRNEKERKLLDRGSAYSSTQDINIKEETDGPRSDPYARNLSNQDLNDPLKSHTKIKNSSSSEQINFPQDESMFRHKAERPVSMQLISNSNRPSRPISLQLLSTDQAIPDNTNIKGKAITKRQEQLSVSSLPSPQGVSGNIFKRHGHENPSLSRIYPSNVLSPDNSIRLHQEFYNTAENQHLRQYSGDSYLQFNDGAVDSSLTVTSVYVMDSTGQQSKRSIGSISDDEIPDHDTLHPVIDMRNKLEDTLREETLLRKRRNSLNLEKEDMKKRIDEMQDALKRKETRFQVDTSDQIDNLENRLRDIEQQIKGIDRKINSNLLEPCMHHKKRKPSTTNRQAKNLITKIRNVKSKEFMAHSHSVESLTSTASHDSSLERESPFPTLIIDTDKPLHPNAPSERERVPSDGIERNGLEELMITTQKLENGVFSASKRSSLTDGESLSPSSRSKSMTSVDKIRSPIQSIKHAQSNANLIIEDFEKFSAMLMKNQLVTSVMEC